MRKIIRFFLAIVTLSVFIACDHDYLGTQPSGDISEHDVFKDTEGVIYAVNGLAKLMTIQYVGGGYNGEGAIKLLYGETAGNHYRKDRANSVGISNQDYIENVTHVNNYYPWHYYYMLIANANEIIAQVDGVQGLPSVKKYLKAQALSYRAYAYTMLVQIYGNRWQDSNDGQTKSVVLRLSPEDPRAMPLASLKQVYEQVYKDLDQAIVLFTESNYKRNPNDNYLIDANVAHAIFARAALNRQDYQSALSHATHARVGYPLMSLSVYKEGFNKVTSEWLWCSFGTTDDQLNANAYRAFIGYNSEAIGVTSGPSRISKELYETIPVTDVRKQLFLDPTGYDSSTYNATTGVIQTNSPLDIAVRERYEDISTKAKTAAYMQFKIKVTSQPGVMHVNHFRSSEMCLIQAEALYFLGRDKEAITKLVELTKDTQRDSEYVYNKTGVDLLNEIIRYRAIELWGEGFDWFDHKRLNLTIDRKSSKEGGNASDLITKKITPNMNNKWTYRIPKAETDYNSEI
ncbi:RagB/SusD family nutrient uptake outer membrane protein [Myroides odoratimimus]|uniref:RagB/SusD family nutrient uptake outer membrane protein n=1 Tax=Myroides odoratimimus TaxID=76832 RepID=UPI0038D41A7C